MNERISKISNFLGTQVDNSPLVIFRMFFGFLAAAESFGAIMTGWVKKALIVPEFTFSFIGFEWLQPLPGDTMYYYFAVMGIAALMVMLGLYYRASAFVFFVMWSAVYLMQKSHYNNHYYLLMLMSGVMAIMPAHRSHSLDVRFGRVRQSDTCPQACHWFFILQILIVYVYASLNKIHMDWLMAKPIGIWFENKSHYWLVGPLLAQEWFQYVIAWGGVLYDGTIGFILLHPRTRKIGFGLSLIFNLFNSAVFQIGIFPYLMIALTVFFFPTETIRKIFFKKKQVVKPVGGALPPAWTWAFILYFFIQLLLPLRHHLYEGDAHFTEEGHRLSWRMMLRSKSSSIKVEVVDQETEERTIVRLRDYLSAEQRGTMPGQPDMIWQFAQRLKQEYAEKGQTVSVYVSARVSLNGHPYQQIVKDDVDLANIPWERWKHADWILTYESYD